NDADDFEFVGERTRTRETAAHRNAGRGVDLLEIAGRWGASVDHATPGVGVHTGADSPGGGVALRPARAPVRSANFNLRTTISRRYTCRNCSHNCAGIKVTSEFPPRLTSNPGPS